MRIQIVATVSAVALACAATLAQAQPAPAAAAAPATPDAVTPTPATATSTTAAPTPPAAAAHIASGTIIVVEVTQLISTKIQRKGDMFTLKLAEPIKYGEQEVVPAGVPGMGQVVDSQPPGFGGAPGKLVLAARYLEVNGQHVPIHALQLGGSGQDRDALALAVSAIPYVNIASILIHGGQMEVPTGSHAYAKLGANLPVPDAPPAKPADPAPTPAPAPATTPAAAPQTTTVPEGKPQ